VDDTLLHGSVQLADGFEHSNLRGGLVAAGQNGAGFGDRGTGVTAHNAVINAAFFVLPVSLNLRLNVSQSTSSGKKLSFYSGAEFYPMGIVLSSTN
jgi:hypothetical protein